jgi:cyclophilin family peptidyl-prolyl cis-trans isomerase
MIRIFAVFVALAFAAPAMGQSLPAGLDKANAIVIDTTKGRIVIKLRTDIAPKHAEMIKLLTREGFYNNVPFHRVMDGFMAQTGDGKNFDGSGHSDHPNPPDEFSRVSFRRGVVGMASTGQPNSSNCQFFIVFGDASFLDGKYSVVGEVVSGMEIADKLKKAPPGSQSGSVTDPDKMVKVQVASDIK